MGRPKKETKDKRKCGTIVLSPEQWAAITREGLRVNLPKSRIIGRLIDMANL